MLAPATLPQQFVEWNRRWGAPNGYRTRRLIPQSRSSWRWKVPHLVGPFAFQENNSTRRFEYPWAFHAALIGSQSTLVDLGGSLSGFQFVLSKAGASVINVDPGEESAGLGWPVTERAIGRLNKGFGTDVELRRATLESAGVADCSVDVLYSISTIEHIAPAELDGLAGHIGRVLKPGGTAVLTIDLFLDLAPFSSRTENAWGRNIDVRRLVEQSRLTLEAGIPSQLFGYPEFKGNAIMANLADFRIGDYPALAQCLVLRKPG